MPPDEPVLPTTFLREAAEIDDHVRSWIAVMPEAVRRYADAWDLEVGPAFEPGGATAWVAPARTPVGADVVLKVGMRHPEADHEADALRLWNGAGAVRLLAYAHDERSLAFVLERCVPGTPLRERPLDEQDEVVASVLSRTWATAYDGVGFRPLRDLCAIWADETEERIAAHPEAIDAALVRDALALLRSMPEDAVDEVLLCTDLHAGNILAAEREPWLLVDPKPYVGDPAYDVVQHLLNERPRLVADPYAVTARIAGLCDLDVRRVRGWMFARCVTELFWWPDLLPAARALASAKWTDRSVS